MKRVLRTALLLALVVGVTLAGGHGEADSARDPRWSSTRSYYSPSGDEAPAAVALEPCLVSLIDDVDVPAAEAGVLQEVKVHEGEEVKPKQLLAQVDATKAKLQEQVVQRQHEQAKLQAENDVAVRFSQAQADVSQAEHEEALAANRISDGAVAAAEVRRLQLTAKRSKLGIEQAQYEKDVAGWAEKVRAAELNTAQHDVERRRITAPIDGLVVEVFKRPGEWVQAGEHVLRVVRMNRLRVEGFVDSAKLGDEELVDRPVKVLVHRQRGTTEEFTGKITFVNPLIEASGNYRVWAEVENRQQDGRWLLRPGMEARMTIELKSRLTAGVGHKSTR
jgi:multidrug efflux pump subunit AcrA (membrane-fusion protein)